MTIELRAVETTYRCMMGNAQFLESQFLHDAAAGLVAVEESDSDCPCTKVPERVPDSCVCRLCRHAPPGVLRRCPVSCLIDILLVGEVQCGSNNKILVDPMESGQRRFLLDTGSPSRGESNFPSLPSTVGCRR